MIRVSSKFENFYNPMILEKKILLKVLDITIAK